MEIPQEQVFSLGPVTQWGDIGSDSSGMKSKVQSGALTDEMKDASSQLCWPRSWPFCDKMVISPYT